MVVCHLRLPLIFALCLAGAAFADVARETRPSSHLPNAAETSRASSPLKLDAMLDDVRLLASIEFEGRKTGTPGNKLARQLIAGRFKALGLKAFAPGYLQPFSFTHRSMRTKTETGYPDAANVIGYLTGTAAPEKFLVISAHYDHLGIINGVTYPGADDNASGVAALLAFAAYFKTNPPKHSILFAAFDAEEIGVRGAAAFMAAPPVSREQLVMILNMDMISQNQRNEIYVAGIHHRPWLRPYVAEAALRSPAKVFPGHDRATKLAGGAEDWTHSSDHGPFHAAGIPFLYFGVEDHPHYHQATDTFANFNQVFFGRTAQLILDMALVLDRNLGRIARSSGR